MGNPAGTTHEHETQPAAERRRDPEYVSGAEAAALGLPKRAAGGLSILSRVAGWAAHVIEQRLSSAMLRLRAKFVE